MLKKILLQKEYLVWRVLQEFTVLIRKRRQLFSYLVKDISFKFYLDNSLNILSAETQRLEEHLPLKSIDTVVLSQEDHQILAIHSFDK